MKRLLISAVTALAALSLLALPSLAAPPEHAQVNRQLAEVRQATAKYHDVEAAAADGYELATPCIGAMGFHYQRGIAAHSGELDPTSPEILVYAPKRNGELKLVAVEYAVWGEATLFGQEFDAPHEGGGPPFHTLHAWVWQGNPDGVFEAHNRNIVCHD